MPAWFRLLRPGDWTKNVFVLIAPVFWLASRRAGEHPGDLGPIVMATALAFAAFCLCASGFYAVNDAIDAPRDRTHPVKRKRPVASGEISPGAAKAVGAVLIAAGIAVAFAAGRGAGMTLVAYAILQALYNAAFKRWSVIDVSTVAIGFSMRAACGALAIGTPISPWLVALVFSLTFYLGFIKRLCDLSSARLAGNDAWRSPAGYDDPIELSWLLGLGATLTVVGYLTYALSRHAGEIFGVRSAGLALLTPFVIIAIFRFYRRARLGQSDSPLAALREDPVVLGSIILFTAGTLAVLYAPGVGDALGGLFLFEAPPKSG
jgi:decaprenyl-phosphate phosphoribosyltransferase